MEVKIKNRDISVVQYYTDTSAPRVVVTAGQYHWAVTINDIEPVELIRLLQEAVDAQQRAEEARYTAEQEDYDRERYLEERYDER